MGMVKKKGLWGFVFIIVVSFLFSMDTIPSGANSHSVTVDLPVEMDTVKIDTQYYPDGENGYHYAGYQDGYGILETAIKFDTSEVSSNIQSAELSVYVFEAETESYLQFWGSGDNDWSEVEIGHGFPTNKDETGPIFTLDQNKGFGTGRHSIEVTDYFRNNQAGSDKATFVITGNDTAMSGNTLVYLHSRNTPRIDKETFLRVTYTPQSSNADLSDLTMSAGTLDPTFDANTLSYTSSVGNEVSSISVTPEVADEMAAVTVGGDGVVSGGVSSAIPLSIGANWIPVEVTAQDGTAKTYTINVTRAQSSNADLSDLTMSVGTLDPTFDANTLSYTSSVGNEVSSISVTPEVADEMAAVTVDAVGVVSGDASSAITLSVGANSIPVEVSAQDGKTKTYTINVTRLSNNADLSDLKMSEGILDPTFDANTLSYTSSVGNEVSSITVTPTVADGTAAVTVAGGEVVSGDASSTIPLNIGANAIPVEVTAQDGTIKTYTITFTRIKSPPTGMVEINGGASYTNELDVVLSVTYDDPVEMSFSNDETDWSDWEAADSVKPWTLASGDGIKTVYMQLRDDQGNLSDVYSDNIILNTVIPLISLTLNTEDPTNEDVEIIADIDGTGSGITERKWAAGEEEKAYFTDEGEAFTDSFNVSENGTYTVYARDDAGNEAVETITITNIDKSDPTISLTPNTEDPTNEDVEITADIDGTGSGIAERKWTAGEEEKAYFTDEGEAFTGSFDVSENGTYTVYAGDEAGNEAVESITVTNIDKKDPTINLTRNTEDPTNEDVEITADIDGTGSGIAERKWAAGEEEKAYFTDEGEAFTGSFDVSENGTYTVYAGDEAGNEAVETITVKNIDRTLPIIDFTLNSDGPTKENVEVNVTADGIDSDIDALKWAVGDIDAAQIEAEGSLFTDSFTLTENGSYTLYARDVAGNITTATLEVENIVSDSPTLSWSITPDTVTNQLVEIAVTSEVSGEGVGNSIEVTKWASGQHGTTYFEAEGEPFVDDFHVEDNGTYTVFARDTVGYEVVESISVDNIITERPTITLESDSSEPTGDPVTIKVTESVSGSADVNDTDMIQWSYGEKEMEDFETTGHDISQEREFTVSENGTYTVFVQDLLGNRQIATITVDNIFDNNADLGSLKLLANGNAVTLDPSFTSEETTYHVQVSHPVNTLIVEGISSSEEGTVTVNGEVLTDDNQSEVNLTTGSNVIEVKVTAELDTIEKVYTLNVDRASLPTPPPSTEPEDNDGRSVSLNGNSITVDMEFDIMPDGTTVEQLNFALSHLESALSQSSEREAIHLRLNNDGATADKLRLSFTQELAERIQAENRMLIIETSDATINLPPLAEGEISEALNFSFARVNEEDDRAKVEADIWDIHNSQDIQTLRRASRISLLGPPVIIEADHAPRKTELVFPFDTDRSGTDLTTYLNSVGVYIQHSNGDTRIVDPTRVLDEDGVIHGLAIEVDRFSTFALFESDPTTDTGEDNSIVEDEGTGEDDSIVEDEGTGEDNSIGKDESVGEDDSLEKDEDTEENEGAGDVEKEEESSEDKLPVTATNFYNYLFLGLAFLSVGLIVFFSRRKKIDMV
ncbi:cadherin-like beta sandwich domain-containing protein [Salipaludibacillus sp. HK11]|uniref:cadherin-like beta sandwich domain-containing protein n=1 Tax=Salipaludibacillus sp. HK11 TaxID=3394320 RepID=UPI0039FD9E28